eukprot:GHVU01143644.1.p3 GENE.GHVU01143644.1~~GHVU01143644.1.p3  ORF type:complete len:108 (+),score=19.88 GHVU01143644.1:422-745(+)
MQGSRGRNGIASGRERAAAAVEVPDTATAATIAPTKQQLLLQQRQRQQDSSTSIGAGSQRVVSTYRTNGQGTALAALYSGEHTRTFMHIFAPAHTLTFVQIFIHTYL